MPIKAKDLPYRVTIGQPTTTVSDAGDPKQSYTTIATRWANVEPVSSNESEQGGGMIQTSTHKVTLRQFETITTDNVIVWRGQTLNVIEINHDNNTRETVCMCRQGG